MLVEFIEIFEADSALRADPYIRFVQRIKNLILNHRDSPIQ